MLEYMKLIEPKSQRDITENIYLVVQEHFKRFQTHRQTYESERLFVI